MKSALLTTTLSMDAVKKRVTQTNSINGVLRVVRADAKKGTSASTTRRRKSSETSMYQLISAAGIEPDPLKIQASQTHTRKHTHLHAGP